MSALTGVKCTFLGSMAWDDSSFIQSMASTLVGFDMVSVSSTSEVMASTGSVKVPQPFWGCLDVVFLFSPDFLLPPVLVVLDGIPSTGALIYPAC